MSKSDGIDSILDSFADTAEVDKSELGKWHKKRRLETYRGSGAKLYILFKRTLPKGSYAPIPKQLDESMFRGRFQNINMDEY